MIYVTGDTHGDRDRFCDAVMPGESDLTENDHLIICGDFGYIFRGGYDEDHFLDGLTKKPYTICFVDGNHENFPGINAYPTETWCGGRIHRIRENIIHLMRGQVFTIEGKTIFTMGGAYSIDRFCRTLGVSWWEEELPCNSEYREATRNLAEHGNRVDYIITHTTSKRNIIRMATDKSTGIFHMPDAKDSELTGFFDWIEDTVEYSHWYFGHFHIDRRITSKATALMFDLLKTE